MFNFLNKSKPLCKGTTIKIDTKEPIEHKPTTKLNLAEELRAKINIAALVYIWCKYSSECYDDDVDLAEALNIPIKGKNYGTCLCFKYYPFNFDGKYSDDKLELFIYHAGEYHKICHFGGDYCKPFTNIHGLVQPNQVYFSELGCEIFFQ